MSDFEQRLPLDRIRDGDRIDLSAGADECRTIADRLGLLSLNRLEAHAVLSFVPAPNGSEPEEEIELGSGDLDTIVHDGSAIELGREIADTLALSIDPYPRSAGAEVALKEAGVMSEEEAGPFAALAALKSKMGESPS